MSKNIIIQQDGQAQNLNNVPKISTPTLEGGSCTWVPEDEADTYARTQTLRVDENGTYTPEEGYAGFSEVTVDVEPTLTTRHITENGTYRASDEQADGYSLVSVAVPSASHLGSKMISENGTYRAADDDLDGYDVVYVSVTSISGEDYSVDVGEDQVDIVVTDEDTEYNYGVDPETDIASMIVTDPEDGEKYIVSVEPDGTITRKLFPTKMVITTPPNKTTYTEGETMDYTGIVVTLYDKAGNVFTDDVYTTGVIPFAELEFPVAVAPEGSGGGTITTDVDVTPFTNPLTFLTPVPNSIQYTGYNGTTNSLRLKPNYDDGLGEVAGWWMINNTGYNGWGHAFVASRNPSFTYDGGRTPNQYTRDGKTAYYADVQLGFTSAAPITAVTPTVNEGTFNNTSGMAGLMAWVALYGSTSGSAISIPVLWRAPTSHFPVTMTFRETFEIEVTNNE